MTAGELFLIALGLSMDAFALAVCMGLSLERLRADVMLTTGFLFGGFQFLMPVLGWLTARRLESFVKSVDHYVAFGLLAVIGGNMIKDSLSPQRELKELPGTKQLLAMSLAGSIDALAVGISFAFLEVNILRASALIGLVCFLLSCLGIAAGRSFGERLGGRAELAGGIILALMGLKILLEHLGVIGF